MSDTNSPLLRRRSIISLADEGSTPGTSALGSVAVLAGQFYNAKFKALKPVVEEREPDGNYPGTIDSPVGPQLAELTFEQDLYVSDCLMTLLPYACFSIASTTATPIWSMSTRKTASIRVNQDGLARNMIGAVVKSLKFRLQVNRCVRAMWSWLGVYSAASDVSLPAQAPLLSQPFMFQGGTTTIGGSAAIPHMSNVEIDVGVDAEGREDQSKTSGYLHCLVNKFRPMVTIDPEMRLVAQTDQYGQLMSAATSAHVYGALRGANTLTFTLARCQKVDVDEEARGARAAHKISFLAHQSSGNDSLIIAQA